MPLILPKSPNFENDAEKKFYKYLENNLDGNWIVYYNYRIKSREFDFMLISPSGVLFVCEIKGIYSENIISIEDNQYINYSKNRRIPSPMKQALDYSYELINTFKERKVKTYVIPIVVYPNIKKEDFHEKGLNIISGEYETILLDDFEDKTIGTKFENIISIPKYANNGFININNDEIFKIRECFETDETLDIKFDKKEKETTNNENGENYTYAVLIGSKNNYDIDVLFENWKRGTKVIFFNNNEDVLEDIKIEFKNKLKNKKIISDKVINDRIYNFDFHRADILKDFFITNEQFDKESSFIKELGKISNFNYEQFSIEFSVCDKNIIVKASAGTGKTYSMINRIAYLIYKEKNLQEDITKLFAMITFTRNAADVMRKRLKKHFLMMYILTENYDYNRILDQIDNVNISTTHSFIKKIIVDIHYKIGLGKNIKITTGKHILDVNIKNEIEIENTSNGNEIFKTGIRFHELVKFIGEVIHKIKSKNIDINNREFRLYLDDDDNKTKLFFEMLERIIRESNKKAYDELKKHNKISLSDLIIELISAIDSSSSFENYYGRTFKYLFIDEFQDTDDEQIELFKKLQLILKFKFFIVGDIKQSIYRFRGADDQAFDRITGDNAEWIQHYLRINYRTSNELLKHINKFSEILAQKNYLDYTRDSQLYSYIEPEKIFFKEYCDVGSSENDLKKELLDYINDKELTSAAILVRTNKEIRKINKFAKENNFDIISNGKKSFYNTVPIIELYKMLSALIFHKNPIYLFDLLRTNYVNKNLNIKIGDKSLVEKYNNNEFIEKWSEYIEDSKMEPAVRILKKIIYDIKPWNNYAAKFNHELSENKRAYYERAIEVLFEEIVGLKNINYVSLIELYNYLNINIVTSRDTEHKLLDEIEHVREKPIKCITVHDAKGLEFDLVIIPNMSRDIIFSNNLSADIIIEQNEVIDLGIKIRYKSENNWKSIQNLIYTRLLEEENINQYKEESRIFYVAMTRAMKKLVIIKEDDNKNSWSGITRGQA